MTEDLSFEVADNLSMERHDAAVVIEEFMLQLHRCLIEHDEGNGIYIEEVMWNEVFPQAYFHFLGFLGKFSQRSVWEPGSAHEYIARLFRPADGRPSSHQRSVWKKAPLYRDSHVSLDSK